MSRIPAREHDSAFSALSFFKRCGPGSLPLFAPPRGGSKIIFNCFMRCGPGSPPLLSAPVAHAAFSAASRAA
eukprot:8863458-Alexandrium_andersonii.AAC.1